MFALFPFSFFFHAYVGWRLLPALGAVPPLQYALAGVLALSAPLMPLGLIASRWAGDGADRQRGRRRADLAAWVGLLFMGLFSSLFVLTVLRDVGLSAAWLLSATVPALREGSAAAVPLLAALITACGIANARRTASVVTVDVPIDGLPPALRGFTIAQISDIHVGPTIKGPYLQGIVDVVNRIGADLVAVTGDLVDGSVRDLGPHVASLARLRSRHGTFFVTGNHEYYSGAHAWIGELQRLGVRVLMNEHVVLAHGAAHVVLAGVTDFSAHHFHPSHQSDPQGAMAGAPAHAAVRVLLAHQPRSAEAAERAGFHLQLSGHTHGGQFLPWNFFVPLQQPFTAGLHRLRALWVYTSRGTGYWGPPMRFGAPSEITRLRLVPALA